MKRNFHALLLLMTTIAGSTAFAGESKITLYTTPLRSHPRFMKDALLNQQWKRHKSTFIRLVQSAAGDSAALYNAQIQTASFLRYAIDSGHDAWALELIEVYSNAFGALKKISEYNYSYPVIRENGKVTVPVAKKLKLSREFRIWLNKKGDEVVLDNSQFLYPVSTLLLWIAKNPKHRNDPIVKSFVAGFYGVALRDHYLRWVLGKDTPMGVVQVAGWDCNIGNFTYEQHFKNLIGRKYGTPVFEKARPIPYCNSLTDSDLFIAMGVMNLLRASELEPGLFPIADADKPRLRSFLKDFIALLNSRIVSENVRTPAGKTVRTINIDPNSPSKHPDNRYAGDTASSFPGWQNPGEKPKRVPRFAENAGWDISHARRFVYLTWSLDRVAVDLGLIAKTEARDIGVALANTLAYRNYNGKPAAPAFANYLGGVNGWYRVNYSDRPGFGYEPYSDELGRSILNGGYAFWTQYQPDLFEVMTAAEKKFDYRDYFDCLEVYSSMPEGFFAQSSLPTRTRTVCN